MKRIAAIKLGLIALLLGAASACRSAAGVAYEEPEPTASFGWLKAQCRGESQLITSTIVVRGRVVANDAFGEWSRALVLEDASGGITVYADAAELAERYPFGASVVLYANGLRLYDYGGKVVVGAATPNAYGGFGIPQESVASYLHRAEDPAAAPEPRRVTLPQIGAAHIDTYVRVEGVRFVEEGSSWCDRDPQTGHFVATERTIVDEAGYAFRVRTAASCTYAAEPLPAGKGSICGVVDYFNGTYTLRVVNREVDFSD